MTVKTSASQGVDFGSINSSIYSGGFTLPAGRWCLYFETRLQQPRENSTFKQVRLGVHLAAYPLDKPGAEPSEQFLSMGSKAHESFMPSDDGKGLVPVAGGPGNLTNKSNWSLFRDSLYNSGLPIGIFSNDFSVLDGIHVVTDQVPEPEERKGFKKSAATGEVQAEEENRAPGKVPVVTEILDSGHPWEGTGGVPEAAPAPTLKAPGKITTMPARPGTLKAPAKPVASAPAASSAVDNDDVKLAAVNALGAVLAMEQYAKGIPKLILKTQVFKHVKENVNQETAQAAQTTFFNNEEAYAGLLAEIGYVISGTQVKAAE